MDCDRAGPQSSLLRGEQWYVHAHMRRECAEAGRALVYCGALSASGANGGATGWRRDGGACLALGRLRLCALAPGGLGRRETAERACCGDAGGRDVPVGTLVGDQPVPYRDDRGSVDRIPRM